MLDETLVPRADVLASLASQKTNVEGRDLCKYLPREASSNSAAKVDGAGGADNALIGRDRASCRDNEGLERESGGGDEMRGGGEK